MELSAIFPCVKLDSKEVEIRTGNKSGQEKENGLHLQQSSAELESKFKDQLTLRFEARCYCVCLSELGQNREGVRQP